MILLFGFQLLISITQVVLLIFIFKWESPKFYIIINDITNANLVVSKIKGDEQSIQNESLWDRFMFSPSEYDWNKDGRTFKSLKYPKYRRSFL